MIGTRQMGPSVRASPWGHHMLGSGQSTFENGAFAVISHVRSACFTDIKVLCQLVGTLYRGSIAVT